MAELGHRLTKTFTNKKCIAGSHVKFWPLNMSVGAAPRHNNANPAEQEISRPLLQRKACRSE